MLIGNPYADVGNWFQGLHQVEPTKRCQRIGAGKSFMNQVGGVRKVIQRAVLCHRLLHRWVARFRRYVVVGVNGGLNAHKSELGLKSCCKSPGLEDQVALDKLLARGWRSCGAHSFRTGNRNSAKPATPQGLKLDENGNVAGFYTNRTDGLKIDHNVIY